MALTLLFLVAALFIYVKYKKPAWKGAYSEHLVNRKLFRLSNEYIIFNNLLFNHNGRSNQIDHIIVSPYGVFVIETKGYKGWIIGDEYSNHWTQILYKNKYQFYNPILQNDGHVKFLNSLIEHLLNVPFIPIVVFDNAASLKVHVKNHIVINRKHLASIISQYKTPVLDEASINWIIRAIRKNSQVVNKQNLKQHKRYIQSQKERRRNSLNQGLCPRCGGHLVLRKGKYGAFYGCSNYPKCKFTINI